MSLYFICENSGSRKPEGQRNVVSFTGSQESGSRKEVRNMEVRKEVRDLEIRKEVRNLEVEVEVMSD